MKKKALRTHMKKKARKTHMIKNCTQNPNDKIHSGGAIVLHWTLLCAWVFNFKWFKVLNWFGYICQNGDMNICQNGDMNICQNDDMKKLKEKSKHLKGQSGAYVCFCKKTLFHQGEGKLIWVHWGNSRFSTREERPFSKTTKKGLLYFLRTSLYTLSAMKHRWTFYLSLKWKNQSMEHCTPPSFGLVSFSHDVQKL